MEGGSWLDVKRRWTLPRYYAMVDWWTENGPPVYIAVAGYLGLIKKKKKSSKPGDLRELAKMFASTGGIIQ